LEDVASDRARRESPQSGLFVLRKESEKKFLKKYKNKKVATTT